MYRVGFRVILYVVLRFQEKDRRQIHSVSRGMANCVNSTGNERVRDRRLEEVRNLKLEQHFYPGL